MKRLSVMLDPNGWPLSGIITSDYIDTAVLVGGAAKSMTVPTGARYVRLKGTVVFYVNLVTTAVVPAGDVTNGTGVMASPDILFVEGVTTISLIASVAATITLEYYK
jgi:hypothetical protein